jgi:hypothetical protein
MFENGKRYEVEAGTAVRRAVGFAPAFDYVAEVTVVNENGDAVTAREGAYTKNGAVTRAKLTVRERASFAGFKRAVGFTGGGVVRDRNTKTATFKVGFAGGAA